jgi:ornithine cyclodeaminase/alanine dehydrogenase-like protein (mu-crystallin family)
MAEVLVLSEAEVAALLDVDELLDALADAFRGLSAGRASVPARIAARAELGMLGAMPVYLPGVALGAKLVTVFPGNHQRGLPSHQGLIVIFGEEDGTAVAVMDGRHITAVRTGAAVVCCCTDAREPVLRAAWLAPGTHVSSVGGTFGPELDADTVRGSRVFVEWRGAALDPPPAGAHELQGLDGDAVTEIGEVLAGTRPGRTSGEEITVYKSTGHAVEDAAAARLVHQRARDAGAGLVVEL